MPIPFAVPLGLALLTGVAWGAKKHYDKNKGVLTPDRQVIFETALNDVKDVTKLRALAKAFREQGLDNEATILEKRAALRELAPEIKEQRREVFKKALSSKDPVAVEAVAKAFEDEGATGAAQRLREYAQALRQEYAQQQSDAAVNPDGMPKGSAAAPIA